MTRPAESVDAKHAMAGLITLAALVCGLFASIAYRITFKEHFRRPLATSPQRVLDPHHGDRATLATSQAAEAERLERPRKAAARIPSTTAQGDATPALYSSGETTAARSRDEAIRPDANELDRASTVGGYPSPSEPWSAEIGSRPPRFVAPGSHGPP